MAPMKAVFPLILALGPSLVAASPRAAGSGAFEEDSDGGGRPDRVVLDNEFVRLVFTADGFGRQFLYTASTAPRRAAGARGWRWRRRRGGLFGRVLLPPTAATSTSVTSTSIPPATSAPLAAV